MDGPSAQREAVEKRPVAGTRMRAKHVVPATGLFLLKLRLQQEFPPSVSPHRGDVIQDAGTSGKRGPCTDRHSTPLLPSERTGRPSWNLAS
ncbi:unnamed protein product [Staurois parvus]|uniref:Uncharacterized protein n=1 Tax=Staurois parvus TaxID=386267 RepID=A0ABN9DRV4_9NEOB|nr:unnamed protein product [Staurois parvus]